jgi:N-methylhydantoinase A/oxoprolinase/acetone carboxylase beta subunit
MLAPLRRIGIDVGGTNTDAVLLEGGEVVHAVKTTTTADVTTGIVTALAELSGHPAVARGAIDAVVIGTTHFVNAVVQREGLARVAAVRIGLPAAASLPPFCDWPKDLADLVRGDVVMLEGGHDYDGRPIVPFDETGMRRAARQIRDSGIGSVAIAAIFSPLDASHEERAAAILREECPQAAITLSRDLGRIGLLERENAALLNAALIPLARTTLAGFAAAIAASGIEAPLYLAQNDGTVMAAAAAATLPVTSFASGATNSMRGAAYLSGLAEAIVVDVGGTSTDVGQLRRGFPREANSVVEVGGVRTLFRMPDLLSIGLGGGSLVGRDPLSVGPHSLGYRLTREALVFGGEVLTATDAAVAAGLADIGDAGAVANLPADLVRAVLGRAHDRIEDAIDRIKIEAGEVPLVAVGGGAFLIPDRLAGISQVVRVAHGECANAVGAAIAEISGETDQIYRDLDRNAAIAAAEAQARDRAVAAGADSASLAVVEIDDMPLAYLPGNALRVRVRVAGAMRAKPAA